MSPAALARRTSSSRITHPSRVSRSIVTAFATLLAPVVVRRLGRVRTVAFLKLLGVPFLVLIGLAPGVVTAGVVFLAALILIGGAVPGKGVARPRSHLFSLEVVNEPG